jgi:hypothetical protein
MMKKLITAVAAFILMVGLSACSEDGTQYNSHSTYEFTMTMNDGTVVPCIKHRDIYGIACNFDKAVRSNTPTP